MPVADPVMTVAHEGKTYQVVVRPGPEGRDEFEQTIRRIFRLSPGDSISLTFGCALPQAARDDPVLGVCACVRGEVALVFVSGGAQSSKWLPCSWVKCHTLRLQELNKHSHTLPAAAGSEVTLTGWECFDAAVFCASLSAGQRRQRERQHVVDAHPPPRPAPIKQAPPQQQQPPMGNLRRALGRARDAFLG